MGVDAIEVDVRLTLDGQPILLHDETLDRTTNSAGSVAATPARKFQNVDAGSWFHPQFAHERVPLLSEFLAAVPASIWINLHVKPDARFADTRAPARTGGDSNAREFTQPHDLPQWNCREIESTHPSDDSDRIGSNGVYDDSPRDDSNG